MPIAALPRARIVGEHRVVPDDEAAIQVVLDAAFDPAAEVVLDREPPAPAGGETADVSAAATIVAQTTTTISLAASTPRSAFVVLNDLYWPGWTATVDGTSAEILRADGLFRAVAIPPGSHQVVFTYGGTRLRVGFAISLLTALACAGVVARVRR